MIADWDRLRVFHAVAEAGSFTRAGQIVGLSQSAISRQIGDLEASLKISLFHRHARGLVLTEQGEVLQRTVREVMLKLKSAEAQITDNRDHPTGELRVTTTFALGALWLTPLLAEFRQTYPDISISLLLDDRELDLSMREADVAIRMIPAKTDSNLLRRHLMYIQLRFYAHRAYLEQRGRPDSLDDLANHALLGFPIEAAAPTENVNWLLQVGLSPGQSRHAALKVNSYQALLTATLNGMGIASLPDYIANPHRELEVVLPEIDIPRVEVFFAYTEDLRSSVKVGVFRDYLLRKSARK